MTGSSYMGHAVRWSIERPMGESRPAGYVLLMFRVSEEDGQFVGLCEELGITSCGDTLAEALDATFEATELYLNTLEELGDRERVFKEKHLRLTGAEPRKTVSPAVHPGEMVTPQRLVLADC